MPECRSICGKPDDFVLPRPFDGQITQARDPQAVRQMPIDCGFDEIGRLNNKKTDAERVPRRPRGLYTVPPAREAHWKPGAGFEQEEKQWKASSQNCSRISNR